MHEPRASKLLNWSNEAQAGESSTTSAWVRAAAARAAGTACSSVPAISCGTVPNCAASRAASCPISRAWAMRGNNGASGAMPPALLTPPAIQTMRW